MIRFRSIRLAALVGLAALAMPALADEAAAPSVLPEAVPTQGGIIPISGIRSSGCSSCAPGHAGGAVAGTNSTSPWLIGEGCRNPIGCGNFASERTFLFGSCRQFFNPGFDCAGPFSHCFPKHSLIYGTGGIGDHKRCEYGSYLNR